MIDVDYSPTDLKRLQQAVTDSRKQLEPAIKTYKKMVEARVGYRYGENGRKEKCPLNMVNETVEVWGASLGSDEPRALVNAWDSDDDGSAMAVETDFNQWSDEQDFGAQLSAAVEDGLYGGLGVIKTGINIEDGGEVDGEFMVSGTPFAKCVIQQDYFYDTEADRLEGRAFRGDVYTVPLEWAKGMEGFDSKARKALVADGGDSNNGESEPSESVRDLFNSYSRISEFEDKVTLCDVYMERDNTLITVPFAGDWTKPLRCVEWTGCHRGPYHELRFMNVPGNVYPLSPLSFLFDMDDILNRLLNKVFRQSEQEKTNFGVLGEADEDIERIIKAIDGMPVRIDSPGGVQTLHSGGASQSTVSIILTLIQLFNRAAKNLDVLGGLSAQSPTASQDELLSRAANKQIEKMQRKVMKFARNVMIDVAYSLYHDPVGERLLQFEMPGNERYRASMKWGPEHRQQHSFFRYKFDINPYSLQRMTPASEVAAMTQLLGNIIMPMLPMLERQGFVLDAPALLRRYGRLMNMRSMDSILVNTGGGPKISEENDGGTVRENRGPQYGGGTHSIYERRGSPGASLQGNLQNLAAMAMAQGGKGAQQSQRQSAVSGAFR